MRVGEFSDLTGFGIEAADDVHLVGRIPDVVIAVDPERVGSRSRPGQVVFLENLRLWIEPADLAALILGVPDDPVIVNFDAPRPAALGGWRPSSYLARVRIDHADFS